MTVRAWATLAVRCFAFYHIFFNAVYILWVFGARIVGQVAERGQGVGQAADGRARQAGARRDLAVGQGFAGAEGAQHLEAARQRGDELAVLRAALPYRLRLHR